MAEILGEYGKDTAQPQAAPARSGGVKEAKSLSYSPPKGPIGIGDPKTPGLHGSNIGTCGTQHK